MNLKYLLFDLDGTLTDPMEGITSSVQHALKAFGIEEPDLEKLTPFIGPPLKESFMEYYGFDEKQAGKAVEKYREWFAPKGIYQNRVYEGIPEMLHRLKLAGKVLAVASSKPQIFVEKILRHFEVYECFDVIVGSELDGTRTSKEEVVGEALGRLFSQIKDDRYESGGDGNGPARLSAAGLRRQAAGVTAMIGDRRFDIAGGKEYGLVTVGCAYGYAGEGELKEAGADYIVRTVEELEALLL